MSDERKRDRLHLPTPRLQYYWAISRMDREVTTAELDAARQEIAKAAQRVKDAKNAH